MLRPNRSPVCVHRVLKASSRFNSNRCPSYRSTFNVFRDSPAKHHPPATPRRLCKFVIGRYLERRWFPSARASHEASAVSFQRFTPLVSDFGTQSRLYSRDRARLYCWIFVQIYTDMPALGYWGSDLISLHSRRNLRRC